MTGRVELSVVIGTLNRLELLRRSIMSILEQTRTPMVVYVTDAGSTDGTQEFLKAVACDLIIPVFVGERQGQAKAYNQVFRTIRTPLVAWLSDDNEVVNGGIDIAVNVLQKRAEVGMVAIKVKDTQGSFAGSPYIGGISKIGVLNANQGLIRREILERVGYFSEKFGFYGIDPDLTTKVLYSGNDVVYTKSVGIHHRRNWPVNRESPAYATLQEHHQKSLDLYIRKYSVFDRYDRRWHMKKKVWSLVRKKLGLDVDSDTPWAGGLFRDWGNSFMGRYINPFDPWLSFGRDFHLRQHVPFRHLPAKLPEDPV